MVSSNSPTTTQALRFAPLDDNSIKAQTDSGSFSRGRTYFRQGHIRETVRRDATIEAACTGSDVVPYRVRATLARDGARVENPQSFSCTCPRGGFCKHIVALLLTWVDDPGRFVERPALVDLLAGRSQDDLMALIERMVQRYPDLERLVDLPAPAQPGSADAGSANEVSVDAATIRRYAQSAFADFDPYVYEWGKYPGPPADAYDLLEVGKGYMAAAQWANAQVVFTNLAEELAEVLRVFNDEEGEFAGMLIECDAGLAACLGAQATLPEGERLDGEHRERLIQAMYDIWRLDIFETGGIDLSQHGADAIARNVTDAERATVESWLRQENINDRWARGAVTGFIVMLREQAGLVDEELLALYREYELWDEVAGMLLDLDRVSEAIAVANRHIREPHGLLAFADALIGRGGTHVGEALSLVDDYAWEVEGTNPVHDATLQQWLIAQFGSHDRPAAALAVAEKRFRRQPSLQTWQAVQRAADLPGQEPAAWTEIRQNLISHLRSGQDWTVLVDVYLDEGDVAAAIDAFDRRGKQQRPGTWYAMSTGFGDQELNLARAAERDYPDRAVSIYRKKAEGMIGYRQRSSYQVAAGYLARVKEILVRGDRAEEWATLIGELRTTYKSLRALREELDALDLN
jgi:hypothetical protein